MHIIENIRSGENSTFWQPARTRTVHRKDGQDDVKAEILM